ncbi:MAG: hypothetical protein ACRED8_00505 [Caulobacteraceae bacterium]
MGRIVGAFATSHILFPSRGVETAAAEVFEGMMRLRAEVEALDPDVLVVASSDHMNNFTLARQVALAVGVGESFTPLGDMGIPTTGMRGQPDLAWRFARAAEGLGLVPVEEASPDHGMALTRLIASPDPTLPVLPVWINSNMPLPPAPARAFALGEALRKAVEADIGASERIVVVAGGGLSHWLCTPEEGRINQAFDRRFLEMMCQGRFAELAQIGVEELEREAGNGGLELASWLFAAGAVPGAGGEILYYQPIPEWITGMGGVALRP